MTLRHSTLNIVAYYLNWTNISDYGSEAGFSSFTFI